MQRIVGRDAAARMRRSGGRKSAPPGHQDDPRKKFRSRRRITNHPSTIAIIMHRLRVGDQVPGDTAVRRDSRF